MAGPTSEAFFNPWRQYLEGRGVTFHCGFRVNGIEIQDSRIVSLEASDRKRHPISEREIELSGPRHLEMLRDVGLGLPYMKG